MDEFDDQAAVIFSGIRGAFCTILAPLLAIFLGATLGVAGMLVLNNSPGLPLVGNPLLVVVLVVVTMIFDVFGFLLLLVLMGSILSYWLSEHRRREIFILIVFLCWLHVFRYAVTRSNVPLSCLVAVVSLAIMAGLYVSVRFGAYWWVLLRLWFAENREPFADGPCEPDPEEDEDRFNTGDRTVEAPPPAPQKDDDEDPFPRIK